MLLHVSLETERNLEILGQEGPLDDERPEGPVADTIGAPMDASELTARFLDLVDAHYVVSEKAGGIRDRIEAELAAGTYASLSPSAFAEAITADLRECSGDMHFKVVYKDEPQPARVTATEETPEEIAEFRRIARFNNFGCAEVKRLAGNVGYWRIDEFYDLVDGSGPTFVAAMRLLSNTDAIVVDVRGNSGGDSAAVALVCSYFFDVEPVHLNTLESAKTGAQQSWTLPHLDCERYLEKQVYVLIDEKTLSAAEEFAYDLQAQGRATLVGQSTGGAAHAREQFQIDAHYFVNIPTLRPMHPKTNANWEGTGVEPDVNAASESALEVAYRMALRSISERGHAAEDQREEVARALRELSE
ncbi:MAG: S41 family peptidase [Planctomycetota bacterium]